MADWREAEAAWEGSGRRLSRRKVSSWARDRVTSLRLVLTVFDYYRPTRSVAHSFKVVLDVEWENYLTR